MGASVLSVSSRALIDACARLGLNTDQILAAAGLERATIEDSDARIPIDQMQALWRKAYELSEDVVRGRVRRPDARRLHDAPPGHAAFGT